MRLAYVFYRPGMYSLKVIQQDGTVTINVQLGRTYEAALATLAHHCIGLGLSLVTGARGRMARPKEGLPFLAATTLGVTIGEVLSAYGRYREMSNERVGL